jgi:hypothetical protein
MEVVRFTPQPSYPQGKSFRYPLNVRLGGPQSRSGCCVEEIDLIRHLTELPDSSLRASSSFLGLQPSVVLALLHGFVTAHFFSGVGS